MEQTAQPIKYSPAYIEKLNDYVQHPPEDNPANISLEGFAEKIGVTKETVIAWSNKFQKDEQGNLTKEYARPRFREALKRLLDANKPKIIRDARGRILRGIAQDNNKNGLTGAPTKYDPTMVDRANEYIKNAVSTKKRLIGVEDFAIQLGVDDTTILNWANAKLKDEKGELTNKRKYPDFFAAIRKIKTLQKYILMNDGLYGGKEVSAPMAIFLLKVNHGMVEVTHTDLTTKGDKLPTPILGGASNVPTDNSDS